MFERFTKPARESVVQAQGAARRRGDDHIGVEHQRRGHLPFTREAKKALELGLREAIALRHDSIGTEHLLLGLTRAADEPAAGVLHALEAPPASIRASVLAKLRKAS